MKNFAEINRASTGAKKTFNFFEKLWEHGRTLRRVGLVLVMCLIAIPQLWAWSGLHVRSGSYYGGWSYTAEQMTYGDEANKYWDLAHTGGTFYWRLRTDYFNHDVGPYKNNQVMNIGTTGYKVVNTATNSFMTTANAGIIRIQTSQNHDGASDEYPNVWVTRPTVKFKYDFNNDGNANWEMVDATDNNDGTYTYKGLYCGTDFFCAGPNDGDKKAHESGPTTITGSPSAGDRCEFKWNCSGYKYVGKEDENCGMFYITKLLTITYDANGATKGSVPDAQEVLYNTSSTLATNSGNLEKVGYKFKGWYTNSSGTSGTHYDAGGSITRTSNITLYAEWEAADTWYLKGGNSDKEDGSDALGDWKVENYFSFSAEHSFAWSVELAGSTAYQFKLCKNNNGTETWYGNSWHIDATTDPSSLADGDWTFTTSGGNCTLNTGAAGTYVFTIDGKTKTKTGEPVLRVYYPSDADKVFLSKNKYIYLNSSGDGAEWKAGEYTARFWFKATVEDVHTANIDCKYEDDNDLGDAYVYYTKVLDNDYIDRLQIQRLNPSDNTEWNKSQLLYAFKRADAGQNCLVTPTAAGGWTNLLSWGTYCPPMSSASIAHNGTSTKTYGGDGSSTKPYLVATSSSIYVSATSTSTVPDDNMTPYYQFKRGALGTTTDGGESSITTHTYTASGTNNTKEAMTVVARNYYYTTAAFYGALSSTNDTVYYEARTPYSVTHTINGVTASSGSRTGASAVVYGSTYDAQFSADDNYHLPSSIIVKFGGTEKTVDVDYTWNSTTGNLSIPEDKIDGNVEIIINGTGTISYAHTGADAGSAPSDATTYAYDDDVTVKDNTDLMTKDGKVFAGWTDGVNVYVPGKKSGDDDETFKFRGDVTLSPVWKDGAYLFSLEGPTTNGTLNQTDFIVRNAQTNTAVEINGVTFSQSYYKVKGNQTNPLATKQSLTEDVIVYDAQTTDDRVRIYAKNIDGSTAGILQYLVIKEGTAVAVADTVKVNLVAGAAKVVCVDMSNTKGARLAICTSQYDKVVFTQIIASQHGTALKKAGESGYELASPGRLASGSGTIDDMEFSINSTPKFGDTKIKISTTSHYFKFTTTSSVQLQVKISANKHFYVCTDKSNAATTGQSYGGTSGTTYNINLGPTGTYYITGNDGDLTIEKIAFADYVAATAPSAFASTDQAETSVDLSITDATNSKWEIYYNTTGSDPTASTAATVSNITSKTPTITGLTANTSYYMWVRAVTDYFNKSSWVELTSNPVSTTEASCTATIPGNISKGTASGGTGTITLTASGSPATNNTWYWQSASDGTATNLGSGATKDVSAAGTYYIRSYCSTGSGCWSDAKSVIVVAADLLTSISPTLSYPSSVTVGGSTISPTLEGNSGSGSVSYALNSVSPSGSLTIDSETGVVTGVTASGTATVTAKISANGNYAGGSATSSTITVRATPSVSSFTPASGSTIKTGTTITVAGSSSSTVYCLWASSSKTASQIQEGTAGTSGAATVTSAGIASANGTTLYAVATEGGATSSVSSASYTIDDTAPTLSSSVPTNSATDVNTSGTIVLTFSEALGSVDDTKFTLTNATKGAVAIDGSDNTKVNIAYSGASYSTTVTLATAAGAVIDAVGNTSAALSSISFTTKAAPTYYLVTSTTQLNTTDTYIIANSGKTALMSTSMADSNKNPDDVTSGFSVDGSTITVTSSSVNLFKLSSGAGGYGWLFRGGDGSGNYLSSNGTPDSDLWYNSSTTPVNNTGEWAVSFSDGIATMKLGKASTSYNIYYDGTNTKFLQSTSTANIRIYTSAEPSGYAITTGDHDGGTIAITDDEDNVITSAEEDDEVYLTATPNTGYEFRGWKVLNESDERVSVTQSWKPSAHFTMPDEPVTVSAEFTQVNYSIMPKSIMHFEYTIQVGDAEAASGYTNAHYGDVITLAQTSIASGYHLKTWGVTKTESGDEVTMASTNTFVMPAEDVTINPIVGKWYTVTFDANTGNDEDNPDPITQTAVDGAITMPEAPIKSGYTFVNWMIGGTTVAAGGSYTPPTDVTAYAVWKETCAGSTTLFAWTKGTGADISVDETSLNGNNMGTMTTGTSIVARKFGSNNIENKSGGYALGNNDVAIEIQGTVNFAAGDVITITGRSNSDKEARKFSIAPSTVSHAQSTDTVCTNAILNNSSSLDYTATLTATQAGTKIRIFRYDGKTVWVEGITVTRGSGSSCYYVTYDGNGAAGGCTYDPEAHSAGDNVTVLANSFSHPGYSFTGWNTAPDGSGTGYDPNDDDHKTFTITGNTTLYAQWTPATLYFTRAVDGDWTDPLNWEVSGGDPGCIPTIEHDVVIQGKVTLYGPYAEDRKGHGVAKSVRIEFGKNVEIWTEGGLIVAEDIKAKHAADGDYEATTPDDLSIETTILGNGTLITGEENSTTQALYKFRTKAFTCYVNQDGKKRKYYYNQYCGIPFQPIDPMTSYYGCTIYEYGAATDSWITPTTEYLQPFVAYNLLRKNAEDGDDIWLRGTLNLPGKDGEKLLECGWRAEDPGSTINATKTYQDFMFANSWTAPIDISSLDEEDCSANLVQSIYMFNTGYEREKGVKEIGNKDGQWSVFPFKAGKYMKDAVIPGTQAFLVTAMSSDATLTLKYGKHVYTPALEAGGANNFPTRAPKRAKHEEIAPNKLLITVLSDNTILDNMYIFEREDFTEEFDNGWDGTKIIGSTRAPQLYARQGNNKMEVTAVPEMEGLEIGFVAGTDTNSYTFEFEYLESEPLYLYDRETMEFTLIENKGTYSFSTEDNLDHARFVLTRSKSPQIATGFIDAIPSNQEVDTSVRKIIKNDHVYILRGGHVYSIDGSMIK